MKNVIQIAFSWWVWASIKLTHIKQIPIHPAMLWIAMGIGGIMRRDMTAMNSNEKKHAAIIAFIIALRMYGLFLILPVFTIYGATLAGASPVLLGLAVGVYCLTQALLQVPMGFLSDVWGRKKVNGIGVGVVHFRFGPGSHGRFPFMPCCWGV